MAPRKSRIEDNDPLESKSDSVLSSYSNFKPVNQSTSQPVKLSPNEIAKKSTSQQVNESTVQDDNQTKVKTIQTKKVSYQLDKNLVERLDHAHLQLCLERGKQSTPYKEVLVETAIGMFLDQLSDNPKLLEEALIRQQNR